VERQRTPRSRPVCPLCKEQLDELTGLHTCTGCRATYHSECLNELGGCSTLGCELQGRGPAGPVWRPRRDSRLRRLGRARARPRQGPREARRPARDILREEQVQFERTTTGIVLGALGLVVLGVLIASGATASQVLGGLALFAIFAASALANLSRLEDDLD
jgi:hypothetical protein